MSIIAIDSRCPDPAVVSGAAEIIRKGGVVAYPTETVYGLGAHALDAQAVEKVYRLKGRCSGKAISVLVSDRDMLDALVREVSEPAVRLMNAFWPGPLTLVFGAAPGLPSALVGGGETIGVRISSHPVAGALVVQSRCPLTSTSANRSGKLPARSAQEVEEAFGEGIDQILDGGPSTTDLPSTIADVSCGGVKVLREGSIPTEALLRVIGESPPEGAQRVS